MMQLQVRSLLAGVLAAGALAILVLAGMSAFSSSNADLSACMAALQVERMAPGAAQKAAAAQLIQLADPPQQAAAPCTPAATIAPVTAATTPVVVQLSDAEIVAELRTFAGAISDVLQPGYQPPCQKQLFGQGWGGHALCTYGNGERMSRDPQRCFFYSFGISNDYTFDRDLAGRGCTGYALDPSVTYPSRLLPGVQFMEVAATALDDGKPVPWTTVSSVPSLMRWLRHDRVTVLKMDCEGCEFAIAEDVLREDPMMFHRVDQYAVEVHVPQRFMATPRHVHNYAVLLRLLREAGLVLVEAAMSGCSPDDESTGCLPVLAEAGYPCAIGKFVMCQNFLFARPAQ